MRYINAYQIKILWAAALNVLQVRGSEVFIGDQNMTSKCYLLVRHKLIEWNGETYVITNEGRKYL